MRGDQSPRSKGISPLNLIFFLYFSNKQEFLFAFLDNPFILYRRKLFPSISEFSWKTQYVDKFSMQNCIRNIKLGVGRLHLIFFILPLSYTKRQNCFDGLRLPFSDLKRMAMLKFILSLCMIRWIDEQTALDKLRVFHTKAEKKKSSKVESVCFHAVLHSYNLSDVYFSFSFQILQEKQQPPFPSNT